MGDPWNGLIIGAQSVSQRTLARAAGGQVGTGVLPEELEEAAPPPYKVHLLRKPAPNNRCKISGTIVTS